MWLRRLQTRVLLMLRRMCVPMLLHEQLMLMMHWRHVMGRIKMLLLLHLLLLLCLLVRMLMRMVWMLRLRVWTLRRVTAQMLRLLLRLLLRWWLLLVLMIEQLMLLIRTSSSSLARRFKVKLTLLLATKAVHSLQMQFWRVIVGGMAMWHLRRLWQLLLLMLLLRWWWRCSSNMLLLLLMMQRILLLLRWRLLLLLLQLLRIKALIIHGILLRFAGGHRML